MKYQMPKRCAKFVSQYLIPSLDTQRFGKHLKWVDKNNSIFELDWCHKGGPTWTKEEAEVFVEWDKIKGHYQPEDKQYYTKSKQRFRALLYKLTLEGQIKKLKSEDKNKKVYSIGEKKMRKRKKDRNSCDRNGCFSNGENSSDDKDGFYKMSVEGNSYDNIRTNELNDHNYSSLSNSSYTHSDYEDQASFYEKNSAVCTPLYGLSESPEKKVLVQRNYPYSACVNIIDLHVPVSKDTNNPNDFLENVFLEEEFWNLTPVKSEGQMICGDSIYDLPLLTKNTHENLLPAELLEFSVIESSSFNFDNFPFDSNNDDLYPLY